MSREIQLPLGTPGVATLYFRRLNAAGLYWRCDTSVYESFNAANIAAYGAATGSGTPYNVLTEDGSTTVYFGDDPTSGDGSWLAYEQAGAEPHAVNDVLVGSGDFSAYQTGDAYAYLADNLGANGVEATEAGGTGDQLTTIPRTGYKLASDGLDAISATRPSGKATTFPGMIVQLFYRFFGKATQTTTELKTYAADGSTVVTTQTISDDGTTETQGEA